MNAWIRCSLRQITLLLLLRVGGQRTLQTPHTMQWAVRQQTDPVTGTTSSVNSTSTRPATSAVAATTTGMK